MILATLLKTRRLQHGLTQAQLAQKLVVTTQAVSKWETGKAVPSIDNLLTLSDLYNISIDELVQGSAFFKKPYLVGKRFNFKQAISLLIFWLAVSLLVTGFGYQPWWLFVTVFLLGIVIVLPVAIKDYWIIMDSGIELTRYSDNTWIKFKQITVGSPAVTQFNYSDIQRIVLSYRCRQRPSPFDFNPDYYELRLMTHSMTVIIPFTTQTVLFLPQFVSYLNRQNIEVVDDQKIVQSLVEGQSLYANFHGSAKKNT